MQPILDVKNLEVHFPLDEGTIRAVNGVSFSVEPGKTLGIVGESGSGKSVIGQAILRILPAPGVIIDGSMRLMVDGESIELTELDPRGSVARSIRGSDIAMIFQEPMNSFSPVHSLGNQIIEAVRLHTDLSKAEARNRAIEMLAKVGIPHPEQRIGAYPYELSGGMRQRAMIAMALVCNPRVLIADEPTTALDVTIQAQILELLRELQAEFKMAVLFISHNLGVIAEISDEVLVVYAGRVMERAPVDVLFKRPMHPYTKALLKSVPGIDTPVRSQLATIEGILPSPFAEITGCPFAQRCLEKGKKSNCEEDPYLLEKISDHHYVACSHAQSRLKSI